MGDRQGSSAHVGDSRVYVCRQDQIVRITHDHSLAAELIDKGVNPQDVVRFRSILTRSFRGSQFDLHPDVAHVRLVPGDVLLLCTDGLIKAVSTAEIQRTLSTMAQPLAACEALLNKALAAGAQDDVTILIARGIDNA